MIRIYVSNVLFLAFPLYGMEQAAAKTDAFLEHLRTQALGKNDFQGISHVIPKYMNAAQKGDTDAFNKVLELCIAAVSISRQKATLLFTQLELDKTFQEKADAGNGQAAYLYASMLKEQNRDAELTRKYLSSATPTEPRAHMMLLESTENVDALIDHSQALAGQVAALRPAERTTITTALIKQLDDAFTKKGELQTLPALLTWYGIAEKPVSEINQLVEQITKKKLYEQFRDVSSQLFECMKKWSTQDADCAYKFGNILGEAHKVSAPPASQNQAAADQGALNKEQACILWRIAQQQGHQPATWMIIAYDPQFEKRGTAAKIFDAALAQVRNEKRGNVAVDIQAVQDAIKRMASLARTEQELINFGLLYSQGLGKLLPRDSAQAIDFFKRGYRCMFDGLADAGSIIVLEAWEKSMDMPKEMTLKERENRVAALIAILDDHAFNKKNLGAAILLTKIYAFGRFGIKPDTTKLEDFLHKTIAAYEDLAKLMAFFEGAQLEAILKSENHSEAHPTIVGILYSLATSHNSALIPCLLENLNLLFEKGRRRGNANFYKRAINTLNRTNAGFKTIGEAEKREIIALILYHILYDCCELVRKGERLSAPIEKALTTYLISLSNLFVSILTTETPPFVKAGPQLLRLTDSIKTVLNDAECLSKMPPAVGTHLKRIYAIIRLLSNSYYMTEGFLEGCALLRGLNDAYSSQILGGIFNAACKDLNTAGAKSLKLRHLLNYAIATVACHLGYFNTLLDKLYENHELARTNKDAYYTAMNAKYDPVRDFQIAFASASNTIKFLAHLFFFAHFMTLAENAKEEKTQVELRAKAEQERSAAFAIDSFYATFIIGTEYIVAKSLKRDCALGARLLLSVLNGNKKREELSEEIYSHCFNAFNDAVQTLARNPSDENHQFFTELGIAWMQFNKKR